MHHSFLLPFAWFMSNFSVIFKSGKMRKECPHFIVLFLKKEARKTRLRFFHLHPVAAIEEVSFFSLFAIHYKENY